MSSESRLDRARRLRDHARAENEVLAKDCGSLFREQVVEAKKSFPREVAVDLYRKQGGICTECCTPLTDPSDDVAWGRMPCHIDHIIPFALGGGNELENLQLLHPGCNIRKGTSVDPGKLADYLNQRCDERGL